MTLTSVNRIIQCFIYLLPILLWLGCQSYKTDANQVCYKGKCYTVELAQTQEGWAKGLMNRKSLDQDAGMLFIFPYPQKHSFWMKNTLIPLDMIWLDYERYVVHIESDVPPCTKDPCKRYIPNESAHYVLELNAGEAKRSGIKVGSILKFDINNRSQ